MTGRAIDVVTLGETMLSLRSDGLVRLAAAWSSSIAGSESNVAIGLSRLGHAVRWAGRVGGDEPGELVLRTLRAEGVDVATAGREPEDGAATGLVLFEQRLPDRTRVQYYRAGSAGAALTAADAEAAIEGTPRLVHLTGITAALGEGPRQAVRAAITRAREVDADVSFDVNFRSRLWSAAEAVRVLRPFARQATIVVGTADELELVGGVDDLLEAGVREVVVKRGADGAAAVTAQGWVTGQGHDVAVVDSVGAGDAFTSGYLSGVLDGLDLASRLARANACGAFAVATTGDWEGTPTRGELALLEVADGEALR